MGVEREVALEADEQVLAGGVHGPYVSSVQALGPAILGVARLGSLDLLDLAADERAADSPRGVMDGVTFGHFTEGTEPLRRHAGPVG